MSHGARRTQAFLVGWIHVAWRWSLPIIALALILATLGGWYAARTLTINTDRAAMLDPELPFRQTLQEYQKAFHQLDDNLVLVIDGRDPEEARALAREIAGELRARSELFLDVRLPRVDAFFAQQAWLYSDVGKIEATRDRLVGMQRILGELAADPSLRGLFGSLELMTRGRIHGRDVALESFFQQVTEAVHATLHGERSRISWQRFLNEDAADDDAQTRQYVLAKPRLDYGRILPAKTAINAVHELADKHGLSSEGAPRLRITGSLALSHDELATVITGMEWIGLLVLVLVSTVLLAGLRSVQLVLAALITLIVGLIYTAAFAAVAVGQLNLVSIVFGVLYIGLGIDYAIHICMRYQELIVSGVARVQAVERTGGEIGGSLLVCSLTTALSFYAFVPTAYVGVSELGLISGTGMLISFLSTFTLLPALLRWFSPPGTAARVQPDGPLEPLLRHQLGELVVHRRRWVLTIALLVTAGSCWLLPQVRFDANTLNLRDPDSESVKTFRDLLTTQSHSPWGLTILADDSTEAATLAAALRRKSEVARVLWLGSLVPERQDEKLPLVRAIREELHDELNSERLPAPDAEAQLQAIRSLRERLAKLLAVEPQLVAAQRLAAALDAVLREARDALGSERAVLLARLEQHLVGTLPANLAALRQALEARRIELDDLPLHLEELWLSDAGRYRVVAYPSERLENDPAAMAAFAAAVRSVEDAATGPPVQMVESGRTIVAAFQQAFVLALLAALVVLAIMLRSVRDVLLVLGPLLLAAVVTCASTVLFSVPFNFANVIALPLLLGITVDNAIHMVHRARHGGDPLHGVESLRSSTARAIWYSSLTTICSFGNLALSPHPGTASMGVLLTIGVIASLLCTLLLLPALLASVGVQRHGVAHSRATERQ